MSPQAENIRRYIQLCLLAFVVPGLQSCMATSGGAQPTRTAERTSSGTVSAQPAMPDDGDPGIDKGSRLNPAQVQALVAEHDRVRRDVGVGPLSWSAKLAAYAQEWADHLATGGCLFEHRPDSRHGENLFMGTDGVYGVADAVRSWELEKRDYPGGALTESNWYKAGHYTQVVWRQTTALGCASVACGGDRIVVCNYDPPGNMIGQSPY